MLYLASASPRRRQLLSTLKVEFEVIRVDVEEVWNGKESADEYVCRVALEKARAGRLVAPEPLPVLAADTEVILDDRILGKPENREHAMQMLASLSARSHTVLSAVALVDEKEKVVLSHNQVSFRQISEAEIIQYCASDEPLDKAGAYGIQGVAANFLQRLEGSYSSVMGLPLSETAALLQKG